MGVAGALGRAPLKALGKVTGKEIPGSAGPGRARFEIDPEEFARLSPAEQREAREFLERNGDRASDPPLP